MSSPAVPYLSDGLLARAGLLPAAAQHAAGEVLARIEAEGLETVRFGLSDPHGVVRGKTIAASAARSAFADGLAVPSTVLLKDTSQRTVFPVWSGDAGFGGGALTGAGDVLLVPDPATFRVLPWSPRSGWILCDVATRAGGPIPFAPRAVLRTAIARLAAEGLAMVCGLEVEFHVFRVDDPRLTHRDAGIPGAPPDTSPLTRSYELLGESRYDVLEPVIDELRRACQALRLPVRSMEPEFGPSQLEFTFDPGGPLEQADAMILFRSMVKQVCQRMGLHATFMCRPRVDNGAASGWHLHQSVVDLATGRNRFLPAADGALTPLASGWIAGLLRHAAESCLLTTPTVNGYKRFQSHQLAPDRIQWGVDNRGAMIRGLMRAGDRASRIENRVAEPAANPYYCIASQILGGLAGVKAGLVAEPPCELPYDGSAPSLPRSLIAAIEAFERGGLFREALGQPFVDYLSRLKRAEWERYVMTVSEWEQREYFSLL